jgi:glycosyltransferase involved in cell wall biosynthesis
LLEALRAGVPVVASDAGGIPDIVHDGETGWLVPPGDAPAMARALHEVAIDPGEAARRVEKGQRLVETRFSMDGIVRALEECYEDARSRRSGRPGRPGKRT